MRYKMDFNSRIHRRDVISGFSLVELLVVVSIMSLLATVAMVNMGGLNQSSQVASGGNLIVDMANLARQLAVTHEANTALAIIRASAADNAADVGQPKIGLRTVCVMQYLPTTTSSSPQWQMVTPWQSLPRSVSISDDSTQSTVFNSSSTDNLSATYRNVSYESNGTQNVLAVLIFTPEGGLDTNGVTKRMRVVPGKGGKVDTSAVNYYDIVFDPYSGGSKIFRPGEEVR
jgi:general secretion pathway protein G